MKNYRNEKLRKGSKKFYLSKSEIKALNELKRALISKWPGTKFTIFGSKVLRTGDSESDLDILIKLPAPVNSKTRRQIIHKVFDINLNYQTNLSVLIVSEEEWKKPPFSLLPIHQTIEKEGISL